jgi:hypothetical protein
MTFGEVAWIILFSGIMWWGYNYIKQFMPPAASTTARASALRNVAAELQRELGT